MDPIFDPTHLSNRSFSILPNLNRIGIPRVGNAYAADYHYNQPDQTASNAVAPNLGLTYEEDLDEDWDFSGTVLRYIGQMLMEEDMEDRGCMLQESLAFQATERSLYETIGKKYPPSPEPNDSCIFRNGETLIHGFPGNYRGNNVEGMGLEGNVGLESPLDHSLNSQNLQTCPVSVSSLNKSSYGSLSNMIGYTDGLVQSPSRTFHSVPNLISEQQSVLLFRKGVEEASKFLPSENQLFVNLRRDDGSFRQEIREMAVIEENNACQSSGIRVRKNPSVVEADLDENRRSKLAAVFPDSVTRSDEFDKVLVHIPGAQSMKEFKEFRDQLRNGVKRDDVSQERMRGRGSNRTRGRGKKQNSNKVVVDLRSLLIQCAQAVSADDIKSANELIQLIRKHSSPYGDGNQRLAHCLANGLEARLSGTGTQIYKGLVTKTVSAADILKAHRLFLACCPFRMLSNFAANKTIKQLTAFSMRLHVIDFGILYGFQWPTLIQRLSRLEGGPPRLRITGIEFPQPGFRPAQRVEETGKRLASYAEEFRVPFEYNAIAKKWDTISLEELKIDRDEILVVNCLFRGEHLHDETVRVGNSRDNVLKLIRKINPDMFIHGVLNASYNAPFFVTRFREALFHFSSMFDMLETIVPHDDHERLLLERDVFGREALNVVACEGWERVERPETYKQWQVRIIRSGFVQVPFDPNIVKQTTDKVKFDYHKDFMIFEDSRWLLLGWKGRIILALSCWKPDSKA